MFGKIILTFGMATMQTAMITKRLKDAEPTIVDGPNAPAKKSPEITSMIERIISGADDPRAIKERLAIVGFQT